jgi:hypothetical protein
MAMSTIYGCYCSADISYASIPWIWRQWVPDWVTLQYIIYYPVIGCSCIIVKMFYHLMAMISMSTGLSHCVYALLSPARPCHSHTDIYQNYQNYHVKSLFHPLLHILTIKPITSAVRRWALCVSVSPKSILSWLRKLSSYLLPLTLFLFSI